MTLRLGVLVAAVGALVWARPASADTLLIDRPGVHPNYALELEPHVLLGFIDPPGFGHGSGIGVGVRGTIELVDNGFVRSINNTIGLGIGLDWVHYGEGQGQCVRRNPARDCEAWSNEVAVDNFWIPVVMQWNFWLSRNWSVFGEPGGALRYESNETDDDDDFHVEWLQLYLGGRYHFSDSMALTMRLGYPTFSVGLSLLM
jgi:hypothetical protein